MINTFSSTMAYIICYISLFPTNTQNTIEKPFRNKSMCSYCKMKADLTRFNNQVKWSYYVHANTYRTGEWKRVHCPLRKSISKKVICVFAQEPYGLLQMLFGIFVRFVEDGLEPSQTYDEVNKLLQSMSEVHCTKKVMMVDFESRSLPYSHKGNNSCNKLKNYQCLCAVPEDCFYLLSKQ